MGVFKEDNREEIVVIDVSTVKNSYELHQLLKKKLSFPHFYGNNWDAFWDVISRMVELPKKIIFIGWSNVEKNMPHDAKIMVSCLEDLNQRYPSEASEVEFRD